ncbi:DNA replication complex GINS protein SLD5-like [Ctenodactylus gundi]
MTEELELTGQASDGGGEEVVLTPAELIGRLEQARMNEKFAPELLESKPEIVECVMEQLDHMEENLKRVKKEDLKVSIHRMEMERIRYVLSSYLRCRLVKIEKIFPRVLEKERTRPEGEPSRLSPEEFAFAKEYMIHTEAYLRNVALKHMPPNPQKVDLLRTVSQVIFEQISGDPTDAYEVLVDKDALDPRHEDQKLLGLKMGDSESKPPSAPKPLDPGDEADPEREADPCLNEDWPTPPNVLEADLTNLVSDHLK